MGGGVQVTAAEEIRRPRCHGHGKESEEWKRGALLEYLTKVTARAPSGANSGEISGQISPVVAGAGHAAVAVDHVKQMPVQVKDLELFPLVWGSGGQHMVLVYVPRNDP